MPPMASPVRKHRPARRFLIDAGASGSRRGEPVQLAPGEAEHALRVLRLGPGDRALGLDGAGGRYPLEIVRARRTELEAQLHDEVALEPAPGAPGSRQPRIELAVAWPKKPRAEALVDRLVQLGAARIAPLVAARSAPGAERIARARLERVAGEALKQSAGAWLPALEEPRDLQQELGREGSPATFLLDPTAELAAGARLLELGPRAPVRFLIGPEGGFEPSEREAALAAGAEAVWIGTRILRIETAAEAACALAGALLGEPPPGAAETSAESGSP